MGRARDRILKRMADRRQLSKLVVGNTTLGKALSQQKWDMTLHHREAIRKGCEDFGLDHKNPWEVLVLLRFLAEVHYGTRRRREDWGGGPLDASALMADDPLWVANNPWRPKNAPK